MPRIGLAAFVLAAAVASAPRAAEDPVSGYYGATMVYRSGPFEFRTHYRADHTFDMTGSMMGMSRTFHGRWALDGQDRLCRAYEGPQPPDAPDPQCVAFVPHKAGDSWSVAVKGGAIKVSLRPGVQ